MGLLAEAETIELGYIPHVVLGVYLCLLLWLGWVGYRRASGTEEDYYLAGRNQGWLVTSLTIMATFFSSAAMLGVPGVVYKEGVVFALFALNVPLSGAAVYVLGRRIARVGRAKSFVTPADMITDYYGSDVILRLLAATIGFLYAVPYVVIQMRAGGFLSQLLFPGEYSFEIGATGLALITMIYVMIGGMRSVAWTDAVQGLLLIGGMLLGGVAIVWVLGGVGGFFEAVSRLPAASLSSPGTTGSWPPEKMFTVCMFASLGSMIQPAQWMRYYAARSVLTLRRSAVIFALVLTSCFLLGVVPVGLGGQAMYPLTDDAGVYHTDEAGNQVPHPDVGTSKDEFDQIMVVVLKRNLPSLFGAAGAVLVAVISVAIMAASMSTADSNLHALSAVLTRDVYDRLVRPTASQRERTWVGRLIIAAATTLALVLVIVSRHAQFNPLAMIVPLMVLATAFSSQLLPVTLDMLFVRRGTRVGAIAGIVVGLLIVLMFSPLLNVLTADQDLHGAVDLMKRTIDIGAWGLMGNVIAMVLVSAVTRPLDQERVREYKRLMTGSASVDRVQ